MICVWYLSEIQVKIVLLSEYFVRDIQQRSCQQHLFQSWLSSPSKMSLGQELGLLTSKSAGLEFHIGLLRQLPHPRVGGKGTWIRCPGLASLAGDRLTLMHFSLLHFKKLRHCCILTWSSLKLACEPRLRFEAFKFFFLQPVLLWSRCVSHFLPCVSYVSPTFSAVHINCSDVPAQIWAVCRDAPFGEQDFALTTVSNCWRSNNWGIARLLKRLLYSPKEPDIYLLIVC